MKPASVKKFDLLYLGSVVVGLVGFAVNYNTIVAQTNAELAAAGVEGMAGGVLIGSVLFGVAISVALWFLISVLRIELVKWLLVLFAAWNVFSLLAGMGSEMVGGLNLAFGVASTVLTIAAIWYLFRPDAKAWFAEKRGMQDPD